MKFSTREDIEAPADTVFDALSNFERFERAAIKRGADVARLDPLAEVAPGLGWSIRAPVRGRMRRVMCEMTGFDRPNGMVFSAESKGFLMELKLRLVMLSQARTRLGVEFEIRPRGLTSRLLLQSARINKASYARRFEARVQKFASEVELRHLGARTS
ncbi:hypothetical protein DEA8626_04110 [Defluviimonas aquaemixtae]|uniref:Polyketide cyclase / dehydrase and lipid transport n=1 Tax=Albidovulum aquaemixtae TaxID=1542388 RepID=A0A2R8BP07_9RHOB|nr:SRPBCC family protein [Defluviimonas aquaemixtae]SPH25075.1 hypothetical protein DEA8626_04110 [Defluviimonas aquaemixtae]